MPGIDQELYNRLRKRMLMFYFAAGVNLIMGLWVMSVGATQQASGTIVAVVLIFLGFAWLNYYMARKIKHQWDEHLRQHRERQMNGERVNE